ncbi:hypothetical protein R1sor_010207 [Riccia sorocarpa]|uniref:Uncharacterized protein n=1 Tax=Riccia sorocarpa TaxID=122646 RepID=A0ABD3I1E0_9MARC
MLMPGAKTMIDFKRNGKADAALVIKRSIKVTAEGTSGGGHGAWAIMETCKGDAGVISIHAPRKRRQRVQVWSWIMALIDCRKKRQEKEGDEVDTMQSKLQEIQIAIQTGTTEGSIEEMEDTLEKLRRREKVDVQMARVRSRIRWLHEDEAPTKFCFATWKAKLAQESITLLHVEGGRTLSTEEEILEEVHRTYAALYMNEEAANGREEKTQEVLQLIDKKLTDK